MSKKKKYESAREEVYAYLDNLAKEYEKVKDELPQHEIEKMFKYDPKNKELKEERLEREKNFDRNSDFDRSELSEDSDQYYRPPKPEKFKLPRDERGRVLDFGMPWAFEPEREFLKRRARETAGFGHNFEAEESYHSLFIKNWVEDYLGGPIKRWKQIKSADDKVELEPIKSDVLGELQPWRPVIAEINLGYKKIRVKRVIGYREIFKKRLRLSELKWERRVQNSQKNLIKAGPQNILNTSTINCIKLKENSQIYTKNESPEIEKIENLNRVESSSFSSSSEKSSFYENDKISDAKVSFIQNNDDKNHNFHPILSSISNMYSDYSESFQKYLGFFTLNPFLREIPCGGGGREKDRKKYRRKIRERERKNRYFSESSSSSASSSRSKSRIRKRKKTKTKKKYKSKGEPLKLKPKPLSKRPKKEVGFDFTLEKKLKPEPEWIRNPKLSVENPFELEDLKVPLFKAKQLKWLKKPETYKISDRDVRSELKISKKAAHHALDGKDKKFNKGLQCDLLAKKSNFEEKKEDIIEKDFNDNFESFYDDNGNLVPQITRISAKKFIGAPGKMMNTQILAFPVETNEDKSKVLANITIPSSNDESSSSAQNDESDENSSTAGATGQNSSNKTMPQTESEKESQNTSEAQSSSAPTSTLASKESEKKKLSAEKESVEKSKKNDTKDTDVDVAKKNSAVKASPKKSQQIDKKKSTVPKEPSKNLKDDKKNSTVPKAPSKNVQDDKKNSTVPKAPSKNVQDDKKNSTVPKVPSKNVQDDKKNSTVSKSPSKNPQNDKKNSNVPKNPQQNVKKSDAIKEPPKNPQQNDKKNSIALKEPPKAPPQNETKAPNAPKESIKDIDPKVDPKELPKNSLITEPNVGTTPKVAQNVPVAQGDPKLSILGGVTQQTPQLTAAEIFANLNPSLNPGGSISVPILPLGQRPTINAQQPRDSVLKNTTKSETAVPELKVINKKKERDNEWLQLSSSDSDEVMYQAEQVVKPYKKW